MPGQTGRAAGLLYALASTLPATWSRLRTSYSKTINRQEDQVYPEGGLNLKKR